MRRKGLRSTVSLERCPQCRQTTVSTIDSRVAHERRHRRKACDSCGYRWSTVEMELLDIGRKLGPMVAS